MNTKKNILLIVDDYLPDSTKVAAKMMHDLAKDFVAKGCDVTVLTPSSTLRSKYEIRFIDKVEVLFFKSGKIKNISKVRRAVNESLLSYFAWRNCREILQKRQYDGIIYYSPTIFWGALVKKLKKRWKVKAYLVLRDIFPQWTVDNGLLKENSLIHKYFKYFEKQNYRNADIVGVMSKANENWFRTHFRKIANVEVLPNWTSVSKQKVIGTKYREKLGLERKVVFFYGGNIGHAQNMQVLVDLAKELQDDKRAHFLFVGKGDEVELILNQKNDLGLDNITYLEPVEQDTYFEMLSEFDVGLFNLHPSHKTHNFPGKLLGYMEYEKPILGCVNAGNDLKSVVNDAGAGFIFDYEEKQELLNTAKKIIENKSIREEVGRNGFLLLCKYFNVNVISERFYKFFLKGI